MTTSELSTNLALCGGGHRCDDDDDEIVDVPVFTLTTPLLLTLTPFMLIVVVVVVVTVVVQGVRHRVLLLAVTVAGVLLPIDPHLNLWLHTQVKLL